MVQRDRIKLNKSKESGVTLPEKLENLHKIHFRLHKSFDLSGMKKRGKGTDLQEEELF